MVSRFSQKIKQLLVEIFSRSVSLDVIECIFDFWMDDGVIIPHSSWSCYNPQPGDNKQRIIKILQSDFHFIGGFSQSVFYQGGHWRRKSG